MRRLEQSAMQVTEPAGATAAEARFSASPSAAQPSLSPLLRDFLEWVADGSRSYAEAMEAWRSSCPRFTIWEDALANGLMALKCGVGTTMHETQVVLTPRRRVLLAGP